MSLRKNCGVIHSAYPPQKKEKFFDVLSTAKLEGLAEGRTEGKAKGRAETILTTARNLKTCGCPQKTSFALPDCPLMKYRNYKILKSL